MNKIEESISEIINDFLADHEEDKKANGAKIFNHPDKDVIIDILTSLRKVIFPGYFRNRSIKVYTLKNNLSMLIEDNVTIYSGASILGGDTIIGKDVVIGGNAFITRSVPDGAKVSVKNQELRYNYDASKPVERIDIEEDTDWFYII